MPTPADILTRLEPLFQDILDIPDLALVPTLSAQDVDEWDSLNHIRLIAATEQEFGVQLSSREVDGLACVGDMAELVAAKLAG